MTDAVTDRNDNNLSNSIESVRIRLDNIIIILIIVIIVNKIIYKASRYHSEL